MEKRNMLNATRIVYEDSKIGLLKYLEALSRIGEDGLSYYNNYYKKNKLGTDLSDLHLILIESNLLDEVKSATKLSKYKTLNIEVNTALIFGNGLFKKAKADYKPVFIHLTNLLEEICKPENTVSTAYKEAWANNDFGFTIDELFTFVKDDSQGSSFNFDRENLIRFFIKRRLAAIQAIQTYILTLTAEIEDFGDITDNSCSNLSKHINESLETAIFIEKLNLKSDKLVSIPNTLIVEEQMDASKYSEYSTFRSEIHKMDKELNDISIKLKNEPAQTEQYLKDYLELTRKKNAYQFMVTKKGEELNLVQRGYGKIKDNIYENKSAAKMAAAKTALATAGCTLGKAIFNEIVGKGEVNDWRKIGENLAFDAGEALGSALFTLLLGPIGGSVSAQLFGFLRPVEPKRDLHMEKMNKIQSLIEEGFNSLNLKIDELESKLSKDIKNIGETVTRDTKINSLVLSFETSIKQTHSTLNKIEAYYTNIHSKKLSLDHDELFNLNKDLIDNFNLLLVTIFNNKSSLHNFDHKDNLKVENSSIFHQIISTYITDNLVIKDFMEVCDILNPLLDMIFYLGQEYIRLRPKITYSEAAVFWFFDTQNRDNNKEDLHSKIVDKHREESDIKAAFLLGFYQIYQNIIGENNYSFYQLNRASWKSVDERTIATGFALLDIENQKNQYVAHISSEGIQPSGKFELKPVIKNNYYRYYLIPRHQLVAKKNMNDALYSFQSKEIVLPLYCKFGLALHDEVKIFSNSDVISAKIATTNHEIFENSIEFALNKNPDFIPETSEYRLVEKNRWLKCTSDYSGITEILIYELPDNNGPKNFIDGMDVPSNTDLEMIESLIYGKFRLHGEHNLLEISSDRTSNCFLIGDKFEFDRTKNYNVILQSENGRYRVRQFMYYFPTGCLHHRTFLFDRDQIIGSVFPDYNRLSPFKHTVDSRVSIEMNNDSLSLYSLYEGSSTSVARLNTLIFFNQNQESSFLHLTNKGQLLSISNRIYDFVNTINITPSLSKLSGSLRNLEKDFIISSNGEYMFRIILMEYSDGTCNVDAIMSKNLNNGGINVSVLKSEKVYSGQRGFEIAFLNGSLNIIEIYAPTKLSTTIATLKGNFDSANSYLELSNDGKLNVRRNETNKLLGTLFDYYS